MDFNWYALALSIINNVLPEQAFSLLENGKTTKKYNTVNLEDMIKLRQQGMTYKAIGEIYGIKESAVCKRIAYHKNNRPAATGTAN